MNYPTIIKLDEYQLQHLSIIGIEDLKFLKSIKDKDARKFHLTTIIRNNVKSEVIMRRKGLFRIGNGHSYLVKKDGANIGYAYISNVEVNTGEVTLTFAIHQKFRKRKFGKTLIESLSGYLLDQKSINAVKGYVDPRNTACQKLMLTAGFKKIFVSAGKECWKKSK